MPNLNRTTENEIAFAIVQIAKAQASGVATFARCKKEIPNMIALTPGDLVQSITRPNEKMWEQLIRNVKSHFNSEGNYIHEGFLEHVSRVGYRVTPAGRTRKFP